MEFQNSIEDEVFTTVISRLSVVEKKKYCLHPRLKTQD
jgi:hypothetical protein